MAKSVDEIIDSYGFRIWAKCVVAQDFVQRALVETLKKRWNQFIVELGVESDDLETFLTCMKDLVLITCSAVSCQHIKCSKIFKCLRDKIISETSASQSNGDSRRVMDGNNGDLLGMPEVQKQSKSNILFKLARMFQRKETAVGRFCDSGITGLIDMMQNCKLFSFDGSVNTYDTVYKVCQSVITSGNFLMDNGTANEYIKMMSNLLQKITETGIHDCMDTLSCLNNISSKDFSVEYQGREYRNFAVSVLQKRLTALESDGNLRDDDTLNQTKQMLRQLEKPDYKSHTCVVCSKTGDMLCTVPLFDDDDNCTICRNNQWFVTQECVICDEKHRDQTCFPAYHSLCIECFCNMKKFLQNSFLEKQTGIQLHGSIDIEVKKSLAFSATDYRMDSKLPKAFVITFKFDDGMVGMVQGHNICYNSATIETYLPDTKEGREVLEMVKIAFARRHLFTLRSEFPHGGLIITFNGIRLLDGRHFWNGGLFKLRLMLTSRRIFEDTYLEDVKCDLKHKHGITEADIFTSQ